MSWDDDFDADEHGGHRRARPEPPVTGWRVARLAAASVGIVAGAVALVIGAVVAVNLVGTAADPGGFAAPAADGPHVALPPMVELPEGTVGPEGADEFAGDVPAAEPDPTDEGSSGLSAAAPVPVELPLIDAEWAARVASATDIPERALAAYTLAHLVSSAEQPECGVDWATIAAIGSIESAHGSHGAASLDAAGHARPPIIGRALDGDGTAKITDTDGGALDGDTTWDRAVGPMQFIPSTWAEWESDGDGDGAADPNQIDDAALTTARYLCASGSMTTASGWRAAVHSYNHDDDYVDQVARVAQAYATAAG